MAAFFASVVGDLAEFANIAEGSVPSEISGKYCEYMIYFSACFDYY